MEKKFCLGPRWGTEKGASVTWGTMDDPLASIADKLSFPENGPMIAAGFEATASNSRCSITCESDPMLYPGGVSEKA